jgi:CRISPR-associated endonuclease Cas1
MAACKTVPFPRHSAQKQTTITARNGSILLRGWDISVRVRDGHLCLEEGIIGERRIGRLPKVGHGLERLNIVSSKGYVTLDALRWSADQKIPLVMLERDGSMLVTSERSRPADVRLRRAQVLADGAETGLQIAGGLIEYKLANQARMARDRLCDPAAAAEIDRLRGSLSGAGSVDQVRNVEAQAARLYWMAWHGVPVTFPRQELRNVPFHWRSFGTRSSPLTQSPQSAVNPANAMLNYLYTILLGEASIALNIMGLDPALGYIHLDTPHRDSLSADLIEGVRPEVDAFLFDFLSKPLDRRWFFERGNGGCRLMPEICRTLSETAPMWRNAVAPVAEWIAHTLAASSPSGMPLPATRLTRRKLREAKDHAKAPPSRPYQRSRLCVGSVARRSPPTGNTARPVPRCFNASKSSPRQSKPGGRQLIRRKLRPFEGRLRSDIAPRMRSGRDCLAG